MKINILKKGDEVLSVTENQIVVKRKNGEVDVIPLLREEIGIRIDTENIVTIGYGNNTVEMTDKESDMKIINF